MSGQGKTTKLYSAHLINNGWNVLFTCIPNSVHIGVVPIPTSHGVSKQRYPDIAALKDNRLLFVEVEMGLSDSVVADIILRFTEMRQALNNPQIYKEWANKIANVSKLKIPPHPVVETLLVIVKQRATDTRFHELLIANGVEVEHLASSIIISQTSI